MFNSFPCKRKAETALIFRHCQTIRYEMNPQYSLVGRPEEPRCSAERCGDPTSPVRPHWARAAPDSLQRRLQPSLNSQPLSSTGRHHFRVRTDILLSSHTYRTRELSPARHLLRPARHLPAARCLPQRRRPRPGPGGGFRPASVTATTGTPGLFPWLRASYPGWNSLSSQRFSAAWGGDSPPPAMDGRARGMQRCRGYRSRHSATSTASSWPRSCRHSQQPHCIPTRGNRTSPRSVFSFSLPSPPPFQVVPSRAPFSTLRKVPSVGKGRGWRTGAISPSRRA